MTRHSEGSGNALAIVSAIAGALFGLMAGYVIGAQTVRAGVAFAGTPPVAVAPIQPAAPAPPFVNEGELQAYRNILAADPKNAKAATELANRLYDAGRYAEAVPNYQQAFALEPKNVNVSTDLGTALWYSGRADDALAQFARSLTVNPTHPQTLFNVGIVRSEGKQDAAGAIEAWEKLLSTNPSYPEAEKVRRLIEDAKPKLTAGAPAPAR